MRRGAQAAGGSAEGVGEMGPTAHAPLCRACMGRPLGRSARLVLPAVCARAHLMPPGWRVRVLQGGAATSRGMLTVAQQWPNTRAFCGCVQRAGLMGKQWRYQLFLENGQQFLLASRLRKNTKNPNFLMTCDPGARACVPFACVRARCPPLLNQHVPHPACLAAVWQVPCLACCQPIGRGPHSMPRASHMRACAHSRRGR